MIAVVSGLIATCGVGGVFWDYVQYALGLERLGFEVYYLEDANQPCYDVARGDYDYDARWEPFVQRLRDVLSAVSPTLGSRWHFRGDDGRTFGVDDVEELLAAADCFLNVSGSAVLRSEYLPCRRKVYLDTDPGWNHWMRWPLEASEPQPGDHGWRRHDAFATYAERIGAADCPLPDHGLRWVTTRPPVVAECWSGLADAPAGSPWTTVLSWVSAPRPIVDGETVYGTKEREFARIEALPEQTAVPLEIAIGGACPPVERLRARGWSVVDGPSRTATPDAYRSYIASSRGEFSVAKHVYTATRSGWFSCRSTCYLAAGRPVVVQDTGFSEYLPTGEGVFAFRDAREAAQALATVEADHARHAAAARDVAADHFGAERVLGDLLDRLEV